MYQSHCPFAHAPLQWGMSTPEIIPDMPRPADVQPRVEQPIIPETQQQLGVSAPPQNPKPLVADDNQVLVQPVVTTPVIPAPVADPTPTLTVPANIAQSQKELEKGAAGPADLSITWLDMTWLRDVHRAVSRGWKVIFGQK